MNSSEPVSEFVLDGLDGSNPLSFLAALGVLRALDFDRGGVKLRWDNKSLRPVLRLDSPIGGHSELADVLATFVQMVARDVLSEEQYDSEVIAIDPGHFRDFASPSEQTDRARLSVLFAAAFGSDAVVRKSKEGSRIEPTRLSLANGNGHKNLLKDFRTMASAQPLATKGGRQTSIGLPDLAILIEEALFQGKRRKDEGIYSFRWDPLEFRTAAHMAENPKNKSKAPSWTCPGANLLAVVGLTMLPSVPAKSGLATTAIFSHGREEFFAWPLWSCALPLDVVFGLLTVAKRSIDAPPAEWNTDRGVFARFAVQRLSPDKKNLFFTQSFGF